MSNWTKDVALQIYRQLVKLGKVSSKTLSLFGDWMMDNFKNRYVIAGSVIGVVVLVLLLKFLLSINLKKDESAALAVTNKSGTVVMLAADSMSFNTAEQVRDLDNKFIIHTYYGTIGEEEFKLSIDQVEGDKVMGYNVTGAKRKPVEGNIVSKRTEPTGSGGSYTIFNVKLKEPGHDQMDGVFNIELWVWIAEIDRHGYGNWQAYNGKLNRHISINDKKNDFKNQSDRLPATTNGTDSLSQVEGSSIKPQVVANQVQVITADPTHFNQKVKVKLNSLIRDKPDQGSKAIKTASKGKIIRAIEKTSKTEVIEIDSITLPHSWYKVSYNSSNGQTYVGWIYGGYLELN